jgi:hypothetical protein
MKLSLNAKKAYILALMTVILGVLVSFESGNWGWLSRAGSIIVIIGIILTSSQIIEHQRKLKRYRHIESNVSFQRDWAGEDSIRKLIESRIKEEESWDIEGHGLYILIAGTIIWGFGDLVGVFLS